MRFLRKIIILSIVIAIGLSFVFCSRESGTGKNGKPRIFVTIAPLASLASSIGGEKFDVDVLLPPGSEPHFYEPKPAEIEKLSGAVLLFYIGEGMDEWAVKMALNASKPPRAVSVSTGVPRMPLFSQRALIELKKEQKKPAFADPHIWTDPMIVADMIVPIMMRAIIAADPDNENKYIENARKLSDKIRQFSENAKTELSNLRGKSVILNHGSFSYFCQRYGIEVIDILEPIPDMEPSPKDLANIIEIARTKKACAIFSEPMASTKTAQTIASELSIPVIAVDPLGKPGESYIDLMRRNIENLKIISPSK